jgi:hypothetical protein
MADDLFGMETEDQVKYKKELERSSKDRIRVYNPTNEDFDVYNDGYRWTVPGKNKDSGFGAGQQVFPRYLAVSFVTKICDKIFYDKMDEAVKTENERRVKAGLARMTKWEEQMPFEIQFSTITTENKEKRKQIMSMMWLGIEEEYGADMVKEQAAQPKQESDDDFLRKLSSRKASTTPKIGSLDDLLTNTPPKTDVVEETRLKVDLESKSVFELRSIAKKQGLETEKTDKKQALIERLTQND